MLNYQWLSFNALPAAKLYALLKLRSDVFVVEQNCAFSDLDDYDQNCMHLLAANPNGDIVGCARILPPKVKYPEAAIGRLVVHPNWRGQQVGRALMQEAIAYCATHFPASPIVIWAQQHLSPFYESLGFSACSQPAWEDGILHVKMQRTCAL